MKKPFYSKRRLKKMGLKIDIGKNGIGMRISGTNISIRQSFRVMQMIKSYKKPITTNIDGFISSVASLMPIN